MVGQTTVGSPDRLRTDFSNSGRCLVQEERAALPAFDEDLYAQTSRSDDRSLDEMLEEWSVVRRTYEYLIEP